MMDYKRIPLIACASNRGGNYAPLRDAASEYWFDDNPHWRSRL